MRRILGMASAGCLIFVAGSGTLCAQSLTSIPDNAVVMVKVKNLQDVSKKLGVLCQQWGVAAVQPAMADPLTALQGMSGIQQGLKLDGEAGFVVFNPTTIQGQPGEPFVLMLPVSDYPTFLKNFPDAQTNGEISTVTLPNSQEPAFVTKWGSFAAISPNEGLIANRPQGAKPTGETAKQFASRDVVAYLNFSGFRNQAVSGLSFGRMMATQQVEQQLSQQPDKAKYAGTARIAMNQIFNGLEHFMNDTQALTVGIDLSDQGVQFTTVAEFMPDSYLGKAVAGWKTSGKAIATNLPAGKYAVVGGVAIDGTTLNQLLDDAAAPVLEEAKTLGDDAKPFTDYLDAIKLLWKSTESQTFGFAPSAAKVGDGPMFNANLVIQGNSKDILASQSKLITAQDQLTRLFQTPNQPEQKAELKKAAKSVGGVSFDEMITSFTVTNPNDPQAKLLNALYGKDSFSMLFGVVDEKRVVVSSASSDADLTALIAAAKEDKNAILAQPNTSKVSAKLPANAFFNLFVYGDQSLAFVSKFSEAFTGNPIAATLPSSTEPIGIAASTEASAIKIDTYIPSPLVQAIIGASMQEMINRQKQMKNNDGL